MGAEDNGLTLEGLAKLLETQTQRLEALECENAELRSKVATLEDSGTHREEVTTLRSSDTLRSRDGEPAAESDGQVSRRWLLSRAGAAAVGTVAAGALMMGEPRKAKATHYTDDGIATDSVGTHWVFAEAEDGTTALWGTTTSDDNAAAKGENFGSGPGVQGTNAGSGPAVEGTANGSGGTGVKGTGRYGMWGESNQAGFYGVFGRNNTSGGGTGVRGVSANGIGVEGRGKAGVLGSANTASRGAVEGSNESSGGYGVWGNSKGIGVQGTSSAPNLGAVEGHNSGGGTGVAGVGKVGMLAFSHTDGWIGAWGRHTANGIGVAGDSAKGTGVSGESTSGYGGQFKGGKAQLRLVPKSGTAAPTTGRHRQGEIYMDSAGALFVCTAGDGTTVGTWRRVQTAAV